MIKKWQFLIYKLWVFFLPDILAAQTVIDIGRFEEDLRISNFLPSGGLGTSLAAGDVNGDGIDDILSGALTVELFYTAGGGAFLIPGKTSLPRFIDLEKPSGRVAFWGNGPQNYTGFQVDIFDFSSDGLADVFISAPQYFGREHQRAGKIYFLAGRKNWPGEITLQDDPPDNLAATLQGWANAYLGTTLTHGDFNGDGINDLASATFSAAHPGPPTQQATAYIVWGGQRLVNGPITNPTLSHCAIIPPSEKPSSMLIFAANLDGDAYDDLILILAETQFLEPTESGIVGCIIWGRPAWPEIIDLTNTSRAHSDVTFLINRRQHTWVGVRLATGDYDGSGIPDLAVEMRQSSFQPAFAYVYRDPFKQRPPFFDWFDSSHRLLVIEDRYRNDRSFPYTLATLDWNADRFDDLVIASQAYRDNKRIGEGVAYVLYGSSALPDSVDFRKNNARWDIIWGGAESASIEHAIAKADVNDDGKDDLVLGGWSATTKGGVGSGEVYVLLNRATKSNRPVPTHSALLPVSPNPFQNVTVIEFALAQTENVALEIFDLLGRQVRLLRDGNLSAGTYSVLWDGVDEQGNVSASGVYFAILRTGAWVQKQKLLLIR